MEDSQIQLAEPQLVELSTQEMGLDSQKITIPTTLKDKILLTPGVWNGRVFTRENIQRAFDLTDWENKKNYELIVEHQDKPRSVNDWVGYVRNQHINLETGDLMGDLELWDRETIIKLVHAKAKFGISASVPGVELDGVWRCDSYKNFSVVDDPACKNAYINLNQEELAKHTEEDEEKDKKKKKEELQDVGKTSAVNGHSHGFNVDSEGNGKTTTADNHTHNIIKFKIQEADGHIHTITRNEELSEKESNLNIDERRLENRMPKEENQTETPKETVEEVKEEVTEEVKTEEVKESEDKTAELSAKIDKLCQTVIELSSKVAELSEAEAPAKEVKEEVKEDVEEVKEETKVEESKEEVTEESKETETAELSETPNALSVAELSALGGKPGRHSDGTLEMAALLNRSIQ